jgi:hypothetical protein
MLLVAEPIEPEPFGIGRRGTARARCGTGRFENRVVQRSRGFGVGVWCFAQCAAQVSIDLVHPGPSSGSRTALALPRDCIGSR